MGEPAKRRMDRARVWLAAMLLLAVGLRVYRLGAQSLWYDEAVTAQVSAQGIAELTRWTADDIQPPLYYYAVAVWTRMAGRSEWALRFPSAFFGVLTVALLWAAARRLFGRGGSGRWSAGIVAFLAAISPLYVYYAQEARMYTLLTGLGVLAGYALLRVSTGAGAHGSGGARERVCTAVGERMGGGAAARELGWWVVFVFAAVAMLYTHYFGVFLLLAYGICWLAGWFIALHRSRGFVMLSGSAAQSQVRKVVSEASPVAVRGTDPLRALAAFLASVLAISVLYLPWLPALLGRYRVDRSYWQGALKLNEALRHVAISFTSAAPETMLEGDAVRLLPWFGLALLIAVAALLWRGGAKAQGKNVQAKHPEGSWGGGPGAVEGASLPITVPLRLRFAQHPFGTGHASTTGRAAGILALTLLLPIVAILLLASRTPKFNPRYLMLASPAYLLLLAGGIGALLGRTEERASRGAGEQGSRGAGEQRSRGAGEQGSRGAGEQGSRGAGEQRSRGAGEQGSRGAGEQRSRGAEEQGSRGAGEQRSRGAGEQGSRGAGEQGSRGAEEQGSRGAEEQGSGGAGEQGSRGAEEQGSRGAGEQGSRIRTTHQRAASLWDAIRTTLALALISFLIATSAVSLRNWFTDPAFTKAQWRELAAYVRQERTPGEAVLLVSGHAYPAWDYYAADIPFVRLPEIDILDVDARLGFGVGADLASALAGKAGAWLVAWQDDVVDPVGFVPFLLDRGGSEQPVPRQFWHLGLRRWQLTPGATFPSEPQPQHTDAANFAHKLALLGWDDPQDGQITVYWRTLNTLPADYKVSLILEDAAGREVGRWDGRPASYGYPTTRWRPGEELFGRYPLPLPAGAAAGDYFVALAVYADADPSGLDIRDIADNPAGKRVRLGPVKLAP